jgi:hypothetical protein
MANLPLASEGESGEALPIDGIWRLDLNQKRYRFEGGQAWILETLIVGPMRMDPGQVVISEIVQTGPRTYTGRDLGLAGATWQAEASEAGIASVSATLPLPSRGAFTPIELDHPEWYRRQVNAAAILPRPDGTR